MITAKATNLRRKIAQTIITDLKITVCASNTINLIFCYIVSLPQFTGLTIVLILTRLVMFRTLFTSA